MIANLTPAEAGRFVYKRLKNGLYEDAKLDADSRTIYVKRANQKKHGPRLGLFANDDLRTLWVNGGQACYRDVMESISGKDGAVWSIKYSGV